MWSVSESDWWWLLFVVLAIGMALGWVMFEGIPMLWHLVKPWLHVITR